MFPVNASDDVDRKLRGVPRRLRALDIWATRFDGWFPAPDGFHVDGRGNLCWYSKLAISKELDGPRKVRAACARTLLRAGAALAASMPSDGFAVGAMIYAPRVFSSEVFAYASPLALLGQPISDRSLAIEWSIDLPVGMEEHGRLMVFEEEDPEHKWETEMWWYLARPG